MSRTLTFAALMSAVLVSWNSFALADKTTEAPAARNSSWRYDAVGRLARNGNGSKGAPPYVLIDKDGKPRCYVTPDAGVDVVDLVNLRVGVRGSVEAIDGDPLPHIVARGVRPVEGVTKAMHATSLEKQANADTAVKAAAFEEDLPTPQPDPVSSAGPEVIEGGEMMSPSGDPMQHPQVFQDGGVSMHGHGGECGGGCCGHDSCPGAGCAACAVCCMANDPGMWWVRAEYLAWATSGMYIPPLATTGPDEENPGILGEPGTEILYGDETILNDMRSGGRISFGRWLDPCQTWGLGGEYFALADQTADFFAQSDDEGSPIISRPYFTVYGFDADGELKPPGENAELVSLPDVLAGSLRVRSSTGFQGAGAWVRWNICCKNMCFSDCNWCDPCRDPCAGVPGGIRVGMLAGYRFYRLNDSVSITEDLTSLIEESPGEFLINDRFATRNQFNGAELGFVLEARKARWTAELLGKIALGSNRQTVRINGSTVITGSDGDDGTYEGGLLALPTNIGTYNRNKFAVIPQLNANLGYNITPRLRAIVGYTLIYWSSVVRAGDQISLDVNETYLPRAFDEPEGPPRPAFAWRNTDFWAQGINVGLDYRF